MDDNTYTYKQLRDMAAKDVYTALVAKVNGPAATFERDLRVCFGREHPTLQQALVRHVVRPILEVLAEQEQFADARNEAATRFAKEALAGTHGISLPTI